jgi:hypothetical protein
MTGYFPACIGATTMTSLFRLSVTFIKSGFTLLTPTGIVPLSNTVVVGMLILSFSPLCVFVADGDELGLVLVHPWQEMESVHL